MYSTYIIAKQNQSKLKEKRKIQQKENVLYSVQEPETTNSTYFNFEC
jgi:hypothetical protein